jgi:hypothetical protein
MPISITLLSFVTSSLAQKSGALALSPIASS